MLDSLTGTPSKKKISVISLSERHLVGRKKTEANILVFPRYLPILFDVEKTSVNST